MMLNLAWALNPVTGVLIRRGEGTGRLTGRGLRGKTEAEEETTQPQATGHQEPQELEEAGSAALPTP